VAAQFLLYGSSLIFVFCYLYVSAGLLCVLLLALPVPWLLLLLCCAVSAVAVHGGCRLRWAIARRLPTTAVAANAAVLLLLPLFAVLWAGVGRSSALGATLLLLLGRVPFPAPCLHGDLRDDNTLFEV